MNDDATTSILQHMLNGMGPNQIDTDLSNANQTAMGSVKGRTFLLQNSKEVSLQVITACEDILEEQGNGADLIL